jgi:Putative Tad-like Flp pilus-assembly
MFLGMAALAIDLGSLDQAHAQVQAAADAGALAASQDLPSNTGAAAADATTYALKNYPTATVTTATNYGGSADKIQVTVTATRATSFASIFGISSANVSATAVAGGYGKSQQAAILAYADGGTGTSCSSDIGINIQKNNTLISGGIQSNGNLTATGSGTTSLASGAYGTGLGCSCNCTASFTTPPYTSAPISYPLDYRNNPPTCTNFVTGAYTFSSAVTPGVWCDTTGTIALNGATGTGVTFEASGITVANAAVSAPKDANGNYGLLLYQTGCDSTAGNLTVAGNTDTLNGTIFAPCATVTVSQNNASTGFIEANNVNIVFNNFTITGDGPVVAGTGDGLSG